MDTYIQPHSNNWILVTGPRSTRLTMMILIARLAERGPVRVVDSGFQFDGYLLSRILSLRGQVSMRERISLSHMSTCHQILKWLEKADALPAPFVMLDFLSPFYGSSISFNERCKLLRHCMWHLDRLSRIVGGVVSVHPPAITTPEADQLMSIIKSSTSNVWVQHHPIPPLRPETYRPLN